MKVPCSAGSGSGSDSETGDGAGNTPSDCQSISSSYYNTEQSGKVCSLITEKYDRGYGCYYCTKYYCQDFATENEQCEWTGGAAEGRVPYEVYVYDSNKNFLYTKSVSTKYSGTTVCFSFGSDSWKETHLKQCNDCVAEKGRKTGDLIKSYYQCS